MRRKLTASPRNVRKGSISYLECIGKSETVEEQESVNAILTNRTPPIRVPSKHTRLTLPGPIIHLMPLPIHIHPPRLILMLLRKRPNPMLTQKLILIQHLLQYLHQPLLTRQRQQKPLPLPPRLHIRHIPLAHPRPVVDEPLHSLFEAWETVDGRGFEGEGGVERDEADEGSDGELHGVAGAPLDGVEVEAGFFGPEGGGFGALVEGHGVGDEDEVLGEESLLDSSTLPR